MGLDMSMSLVDLIAWILFGALAGWVASIIAGRRQGWLMNIIIGIVGAFLGGFLVQMFTGESVAMGWDWRSFAVAVVGATLLLWGSALIRKRR
jgi:uncharacterized membrane protein YeaQ/YmgE (transglycosylase-associated protein family)